MKTYRYKSADWIDLFKPSEHELHEVGDKFGIDPEIISDLISPTLRHNIAFKDHYAYVVLHFPAFKDFQSDAAFELDFVIGRDFLITAHYHEVAALNEFAEALSADSSLETFEDGRNALVFGLFRALAADFDKKLSKVDLWVRDLEKNMFNGKEKRTIFEISEATRHLIDFKKITAVYPDSFKELSEKGREAFGEEFAKEAENIAELYSRAFEKLNLLTEAVKELRETNDSILSTKQNETMKILTAVTILATIVIGVALFWVGLMAVGR